MNRDSIISDLQALLKQIEDVEVLEVEFTEAKKQLDLANSVLPNKLNEFDLNNKDKYIISKIGDRPVESKGITKLFKNKEYNQLLNEYNVKYIEIEKQYYIEFKDERNSILNTEKQTIENNINLATKKYNDILDLLNTTKTSIINNNLLNDKFKTKLHINKLLNYFYEQRADSIKEAVNLYYDEERYIKLEQLTKQELNEIKQLAYQAIGNANEALAIAKQANSNAIDAQSIAIQALNEAEQAKTATIALM